MNESGVVEEVEGEEVEDDLSASLLQPQFKTMMRTVDNRQR
jgi:hypothetical protein